MILLRASYEGRESFFAILISIWNVLRRFVASYQMQYCACNRSEYMTICIVRTAHAHRSSISVAFSSRCSRPWSRMRNHGQSPKHQFFYISFYSNVSMIRVWLKGDTDTMWNETHAFYACKINVFSLGFLFCFALLYITLFLFCLSSSIFFWKCKALQQISLHCKWATTHTNTHKHTQHNEIFT